LINEKLKIKKGFLKNLTMEKQIKMAAKLYHCRDTAKAFFKDAYKEKLEPYTYILKKVMESNNEDEIQALLRISKTQSYQENGMAQMMFFTAVVEMLEPSN
jgi:hypothetical protein